jgi:thiopurine S-methyltransferase
VEDFFAEHQLQPVITEEGDFRVYRCEGLEIYCGDFFALTPQHVAECQGLYDRAALIALPPEMRGRYVAHLAAILPSDCQGLLVTLDYEQAQMDGPPFAVADSEVQQRLSAVWQVETLQCSDVLGQNWRFLQRGLQRLDERVYRLRKQ